VSRSAKRPSRREAPKRTSGGPRKGLGRPALHQLLVTSVIFFASRVPPNGLHAPERPTRPPSHFLSHTHPQSPHLRLTISQCLNEAKLEKWAISLILEDLAHCVLGRRGIVHFDLPQGLPTNARAAHAHARKDYAWLQRIYTWAATNSVACTSSRSSVPRLRSSATANECAVLISYKYMLEFQK